MPARYRPAYKWQIGWGDDYDHPAADITDLVMSYVSAFGSQPASDGGAVRTSHAVGTLVIWNRDRAYDPDSPRLQVDEKLLRGRNPCRLLMDGVVAWEGIAFNVQRLGGDPRASMASITLEGKSGESLKKNTLELDLSTPTVEGVAQAIRDNFDIEFDGNSEMPTGLVFGRSNGLIWLDNYSRFCGGWCLEDQHGDWAFHNFVESAGRSPDATFPLTYEPIATTLDVRERPGHVRNYVDCRGYVWEPGDDVSVLAVTEVRLNRNQRRVVPLRFRQGRSRLPTGWTDFQVNPESVAFALNTNVDSNAAASVTVQSLGYSAPPPQTVRVSGIGTYLQRVEANVRQIDITEFDTQDTFGRQELLVPPWFRADGFGVGDITKPWLRNLSQPPEHVIITYNEWQHNRAAAHALRDHAVPGKAIDIQVVVENTVRTYELLVLAVQIRGGFRRPPQRRIVGVVRRAEPPAPLTVSIDHITARTAVAEVGVESPAGEQVHLALTQGRLSFRDLVVEANDERNQVQLTRLQPSTFYQVQAALDSTYQVGAVSASFTTPADTDSVVLSRLWYLLPRDSLPGRLVTADYTAFDDPASDVPVSTLNQSVLLNQEGTISVRAEPLDSSATVTIQNDRQTAVPGETLTFNITVSNGSNRRLYVLNLFVNAPLARPVVTSTVGSRRIHLSWDEVPFASGYGIQWSSRQHFPDSGTLSDLVDDTSYTIENLRNGEQVFYRVRAYNDGGDGPWSAGLTSATPRIMLPATPGRPTLAPGDRQIEVVWTDVPNADTYDVQWATNTAFTQGLGTRNTEYVSALFLGGLTNLRRYYVRIRARNADGASAYSSSAFETPREITSPPSVAPTLTLSTGSNSITARWNRVPDAVGYESQWSTRSTASGNVWSIFDPDHVSRQVTGLSPGTTYYFRVRAFNLEGDGPWSTIQSAVVPLPPSPTAAPTGIPTLTVRGGVGQATASWTAVARATFYEVQYSPGAGAVGNPTTVVDTTLTVRGLTPDRWWFRVRARNSAGSGPWSPRRNGLVT